MLVAETFIADNAITAGPIAGPAGQVLVGRQNGTLYSLTKDLGLRWQRNIGTAIAGMPAFSSDALYVMAGNRLRAYNPFSGAPLWTARAGAWRGRWFSCGRLWPRTRHADHQRQSVRLWRGLDESSDRGKRGTGCHKQPPSRH